MNTMRNKVKQFFKHPLIYGSAIVVLGNLFANFFNFLFNLFMSRSLTVAEYGVLASVMSIIAFPALVGGAIVPVVVRFAGDYFATQKYPLLRGLYIKIKKLLLLIAGVFFILFLLFTPQIGQFFHIEDKNILYMTNVIIFIAVMGLLNMAFLQAKLAFLFQVLITLINAIVKLALGSVLVILGFSVSGATIAMIVSGVIGYMVSFIPIRFIFNRKISAPSIKTEELFSYGLPSTLTLIGLTSFISTDIILVKHFFDPHQAGLYAGLSLIGRIIFFVSAPIGGVMFPVIVQKHSKNENFTNTFKLALLLVFVPSILLTVFYALFPKFSILFFLKREEYLHISPLLASFALFIALYCLLSIIANFYLSIKKTKVFIPVIVGAILQIVFIYFYHQTFSQIILISTVITLLLVILLLAYYPRATKLRG